MDNLEFLLQREGDSTWLPLESPDVEILEGRYRIVSRSPHLDQKIEIRIVYDALDEVPPVRRVKTRSSYINSEGLMVVIPYTRLKPGIWEFSCSPDLEQGLLGNTWRATIQLQVLATDIDSEDVLEELPRVEDVAETGAKSDREVQPQTSLEKPSLTQTSSTFKVSEPQYEEASQEPLPAINEELGLDQGEGDLSVQLDLERDTYVVEFGQAILLSGQVSVKSDHEVDAIKTTSSRLLVSNPELRICLRDPQASEVIYDIRQPMPQSVLPVPFSAAIYVPFECKTRLVLGEVIFYSDKVPSVRYPFTITMLVEQFLEPLEDELEMEENQAESVVTNFSMASDVEVMEKEVQPLGENRLVEEHSSLELPSFGNFLGDQTEEGSWSNLFQMSSGSELEPDVQPRETLEGTAENDPNLLTEEPETLTESLPESSDFTITSGDRSLPGLNLEERFLTRLSSLAQDRDLSNWMKQASPPSSLDTSRSPQGESAALEEGQNVPLDDYGLSPFVAELEAEEIVVDDESLEPPVFFPQQRTMSQFSGRERDKVSASTDDRHSQPPIIPEDQEIPAPVLDVLTPNPMAGRPLKVRVQIPDDLPRIYVKIWVYDRQSRNIVDGPRWITEFSPNGFDQIEAKVDLDILYGSLEVQVEAIAVEMQTQRESHKAIVGRTVNPTASPTLPMDETSS